VLFLEEIPSCCGADQASGAGNTNFHTFFMAVFVV